MVQGQRGNRASRQKKQTADDRIGRLSLTQTTEAGRQMLETEKLPIDPDVIRRDFPILDQTVHGNKELIYFDNAASTQRPNQVIDAVVRSYRESYANVHRGNHALAMASDELYEEARLKVADFIGAGTTSEIVFTSGATMALNIVARSWGDANIGAGDEILLTEMEHHSNIVPWQQLAERSGCRVRFLPISEDGLLRVDLLDDYLTERTKLFAFTAVSNVLGTINPVQELVQRARIAGALTVVDAAQHVPHEEMTVDQWDADFIAFSGHKMLGPSGIGILWGRRDLLEAMPPFLGGGSMISTVTQSGFTPGELPAKFEAGTPPIVPAIGLGAAIDYLQEVGLPSISQHERLLVTYAHQLLEEIDGLSIIGPTPKDKAGIVSFVVEGVNSNDLAVFLDLDGIAVRNGHHCAMPLHEKFGIASSTRASFYLYNTLDEVSRLAESLKKVIPKLKV